MTDSPAGLDPEIAALRDDLLEFALSLPFTSTTEPSRPNRSQKLPPLSAGSISPSSVRLMSESSSTRSSPNAFESFGSSTRIAP